MVSAAPNRDRIQFLGRFVCPSLEEDYRRSHLREDIRLGLGCASVAFASSVVYVLNGFQLYGPSTTFFVLLGSRAAILVASLGLVLALRGCKSPTQVDRWLLLWASIVAVANLTMLATGSSGKFGPFFMSLGMPLVAYCVLPLPLSRQLFTVAFSLAALLIALVTGVDSTTLFSLGGAYLIANAIGSFTSWQLQHRRRQVYLAGVRETELRSQLERTLAEVKTLRGLFSICAWCKRIRDEGQAWQPVEAYVQGHSHAEFTHAICDHCLREQLGEEALCRLR